MIFEKRDPSSLARHLVKSYWLIDSEENSSPQVQKIVPDGFPELVLHYGDPYMIRLHGHWELQSKRLIAGQIRSHFYLKNTGRSGMLGIKLMPTALYQLFGVPMHELTGKVVDMQTLLPALDQGLMEVVNNSLPDEKTFDRLDDYFVSLSPGNDGKKLLTDKALDRIFESGGTCSISGLSRELAISERHLERLFKVQVGLSPKYYSRIIRFSKIFDYMQNEDARWASLALESGHFDQSHFIKNFKAFTGEEPSRYLFDQLNMANFFLKK